MMPVRKYFVFSTVTKDSKRKVTGSGFSNRPRKKNFRGTAFVNAVKENFCGGLHAEECR